MVAGPRLFSGHRGCAETAADLMSWSTDTRHRWWTVFRRGSWLPAAQAREECCCAPADRRFNPQSHACTKNAAAPPAEMARP